MVSLGVDSQYRIERMRKLILRPEFTGEAYRWTMKDSGGADSTVSTEREFIFVAEKPGTYALRLDIIDAQNPVMQEVEINVDEESVAYSRYITEVNTVRLPDSSSTSCRSMRKATRKKTCAGKPGKAYRARTTS